MSANLSDLINQVADRTGLSANKSKGIVNEVLAAIVHLTKTQGALTIREFGRFDVRVRPGRNHGTPIQGGALRIPPRETIYFTVSRTLVENLADE